MPAFHDILFPLDVALGARGGPERKTEIVSLGSGREERNARWAHSRRRWNAGYGVKSLTALAGVVAFFEERRGRLYGFRWRDRLDHASGPPDGAVAATDQPLGVGDGIRTAFQLVKTYGGAHAPYVRPIVKPVAGSVQVALGGVAQAAGFAVDSATGLVTFAAAPAMGVVVSAGFLFDVPVRFDADRLDIDLSAFAAGEIPSIPVVEIRL
ncbi:DUF2460 domain-containing protein [Blastochloris tepida]|uniref:Glycoside hydrolase family 24 n=1 Tax=Blastochloris tepida TaxID=2233851 RepID=A0A348G1V1_9HYPH|nr:DUF2460 domain-containing protein [Blastochloris tepida]BBF93534.1 glycoside hydrolase family 24 [Blastochloris tepida]